MRAQIVAARHRPSVHQEPNTANRALLWFVGVLIVVAAGSLAYRSSFGGVFLFDDVPHIVENPHIKHLTPIGTWLHTRRPTVNLSLALNYHFCKLRPWGYHLVNLIIHLLAGLTLFAVVRRTLLLGRFSDAAAGSATPLATAVALLWVVHPLQTQAVTYVVQRGESLMGLFYFLTLYCVIRGSPSADARSKRKLSTRTRLPAMWYALAVGCCALGMGSKAVMVTAPVVVLLYDVIFLSGRLSAALRRRWSLYVGLAATWSILWAVGIGGVFRTETAGQATVGFAVKTVTPWQYAMTQPGVILHYLRLTFWPVGLCLDSDWPAVPKASDALLPAAEILVLLGGTIWALRRKAWLGFLGAWFFVILAPTSSFIPIRDLAFEHRMYLPLAAVLALVVIGGHGLVLRLGKANPSPARWATRSCVAAVVLMAALLGTATARRNAIYHSREAMWRDVVRCAPHNARAHLGLGLVLDEQHRTAEALVQYQQAVQLRPRYAQARSNLGLVLGKLGRFQDAAEQLQTAVKLKPDLMKAYGNLADVYVKQRALKRAVAVFRQALKIKPTWAQGHVRLGVILAMQAKRAAAMAEFSEAIRIAPDTAEPHYCMGVALQQAGRAGEAIREFQVTLRIEPGHADARRRLDRLKDQSRRSSAP